MIEINFEKNIGESDVLAIPVYQDGNKIPGLPTEILERLEAVTKAKGFLGKNGDIYTEIVDQRQVVYLGLGEKSKLTPELAKTAGAKLTASLERVSDKAVDLWLGNRYINTTLSLSLIEGILLRNYLDARFKTGTDLKEAESKLFSKLTIVGEADSKFKNACLDLAKITEGIFLTRNLVSAPPAKMRPEDLAKEAEKLAKEHTNLIYKSLSKKEIEKEGMGLLSAVNRGSAHEPKLIILQLNPDRKEKPVILVGKGLTFDSGGYNLKPEAGIRNMHIDMAGGATVLGAIKALAAIGSKRKVVGIVPATENLISGDAYKPSDIITAYSGTTVEIENTDAEGRLILADAISYGIKEFDPKLVIDLATLTGACMIALGHRYAGIFSNQASLISKAEKAGKASGEKVWPLPLDDTFKQLMKSKIADIGNIGSNGRYAGASTAAAFLSYFVKDTPWLHIDIAGPTQQDKELEAWNPPSGISGFGVRLLVEIVQSDK